MITVDHELSLLKLDMNCHDYSCPQTNMITTDHEPSLRLATNKWLQLATKYNDYSWPYNMITADHKPSQLQMTMNI